MSWAAHYYDRIIIHPRAPTSQRHTHTHPARCPSAHPIPAAGGTWTLVCSLAAHVWSTLALIINVVVSDSWYVLRSPWAFKQDPHARLPGQTKKAREPAACDQRAELQTGPVCPSEVRASVSHSVTSVCFISWNDRCVAEVMKSSPPAQFTQPCFAELSPLGSSPRHVPCKLRQRSRRLCKKW